MPAPLLFRFSPVDGSRKELFADKLSDITAAFGLVADGACPISATDDIEFREDETVRSVKLRDLPTLFENEAGISVDFLTRRYRRAITLNAFTGPRGLSISLEIERLATATPHQEGHGAWVRNFVLKLGGKLKSACAACVTSEAFVARHDSLNCEDLCGLLLQQNMSSEVALFAAIDGRTECREEFERTIKLNFQSAKFGSSGQMLYMSHLSMV